MFSTPMPPISSSATETDTVWIWSGVLPLALSSLKKATLLSPFSVLNTMSGSASRTLDTIVAHVRVAERQVVLADDLQAVRRGVGVDDLVRRAGEDVVGADEVDLRHALLLDVVEGGDDLLVRRGAGVEDVRRRLEALVLHRVVEEPVEALEHRQHRLAAGRRPAAEHGGDLVDGEQLLGLLGERRPVGRAVLDDGLDLLAEHAAGLVDLLDRQQLGVTDGDLADRHRAAQRVQHADLDACRPRAPRRTRWRRPCRSARCPRPRCPPVRSPRPRCRRASCPRPRCRPARCPSASVAGRRGRRRRRRVAGVVVVATARRGEHQRQRSRARRTQLSWSSSSDAPSPLVHAGTRRTVGMLGFALVSKGGPSVKGDAPRPRRGVMVERQAARVPTRRDGVRGQ